MRPPVESLVVARYASGSGFAPGQWARALARVDWDRAELLSDKPEGSVWRATLVPQNRPIACVIKCEPAWTVKRRAQRLLRSSHAWRHWRGARRLTRIGVRTAEPRAIVYGRRDGRLYEVLIMESLPGRTVLEHLRAGDLSVREEHAVAHALAALWNRMTRAGVYNRDHKASNLIVTRLEPGPGGRPRAEIAVIDCVGLRRVRFASRRKLARAAALCYIEAAGFGCAPRMGVVMRYVREVTEGDSKVPRSAGHRHRSRSTRNNMARAVTMECPTQQDCRDR